MTVCIAAICENENNRNVVVASDRMLTFPPPTNLEFETDERKFDRISPTCVILTAGNTGYSTEIIRNTQVRLRGHETHEISEIAEIAKEEYLKCRLAKFEEIHVASILGSDYQRHLSRTGTITDYLQNQPLIYQQLVALANEFNIDLHLLLAGVNASGAHIAHVGNPGTLVFLDTLGYGAVGSGGMHATTTLALSKQSSSKGLVETLGCVYAAKKSSEVAPGVGEQTDMAVIDSNEVWQCPRRVIEALDANYRESSKKNVPNLNALRKVYDEEHSSK